MLLAAHDYWNYKRRRGRYSDSQPDAAMGAFAFVEKIPQEVVEEFQIGDFVFTQRLNSFLSWAMLYVTASSVDHVAIYMGDGKVAHRTLSGVQTHCIHAIARGSRIIVVRMSPEELRECAYELAMSRGQIDKAARWMHRMPPKAQLAVGGMMSVHGKYQGRFRWLLWLEFFTSIALLGALIGFAFNSVALSLAFPALSLFALIYYGIANVITRLRSQSPTIMSHPDIGYRAFFKVGGLMFTNMGPIAVFELGLMPLKVILRLAREGPYDGSDDKFQKAYEFCRYLIESWNIEEFGKQTECGDADEKQNKQV